MDNSEFQLTVQRVMDRLPGWVHQAMEHIEIRVEDEAPEELGPGAEDLLGLYEGTPLTERSVEDFGELPDIIYIFRKPHLEMGLSPDELLDEIATTLVHEIAHYLGIDDDRLEEIGWD